LAVAALGAAQKAVKNADRPALTATDYVEIEQLAARYAFALDTAADRGQEFARLFTPDGIFRTAGSRPYEIKGREQLAAFAMGDLAHRGPSYVHDYASNHIVRPSAEGATGRVYVEWLTIGENGGAGVVETGGHYDDVYVKTRDGWRFKMRTFSPAKLGPDELQSQVRR
jgi:hypothetical protein